MPNPQFTTYLRTNGEWSVWTTSRSLPLALHALGDAPRGEYYVEVEGKTVAVVTLMERRAT